MTEEPLTEGREALRMAILASGAVRAAFFIGFVKTAALEGLFERFVLIDEIDPVTGEARKHPRERKATFVGAAHVMADLVLESTPFGQDAL
jgi:hypothetical protein